MRAIDIAIQTLRVHEGLELKPYKCTTGKLTIGYGRNLTDNGISTFEADAFLEVDARTALEDAKAVVPCYEYLNKARQAVLIDMAYNLGRTKLKGFKKMIQAIEDCDYDEASFQMIDSVWGTQVGERASFLSNTMRDGV